MSGSTKRYPAELRERAVRMVAEVRHEHSSEWAAVESVAGKLGVGTPQTLLNWVRRGQIDSGKRPGLRSYADCVRRTESLSAPTRLRSRRRLSSRRSSTANGSDRRVHRRSQSGVRRRADLQGAHRAQLHGLPRAPTTRRATRPPSTRSVRDEEPKAEITRVREANYSVYGARKVWLQLARENITVARCTVERLMGELGLEGARRGKTKRTTVADPQAYRAGDMVERQFNPVAPSVLWVADFAYVSTWSGWVYVAFVIDAFSRRILGWRSSTTMTTP